MNVIQTIGAMSSDASWYDEKSNRPHLNRPNLGVPNHTTDINSYNERSSISNNIKRLSNSNNRCRSSSLTPPRIHASLSAYKEQCYGQHQSLLRAMQQEHERNKIKRDYLRKLHYMKMTMQEQVYRSHLHLARTTSSTSNDFLEMMDRSSSHLSHGLNLDDDNDDDDDDDDDDDSSFHGYYNETRRLDLLEDTYIDPIVQHHMTLRP